MSKWWVNDRECERLWERILSYRVYRRRLGGIIDSCEEMGERFVTSVPPGRGSPPGRGRDVLHIQIALDAIVDGLYAGRICVVVVGCQVMAIMRRVVSIVVRRG